MPIHDNHQRWLPFLGIEAINSFLQKMLDEAETIAIVKETISYLSNSLNRQLTKKDMGIVMKELKNYIHASEIDMKIASKVVSQNLC